MITNPVLPVTTPVGTENAGVTFLQKLIPNAIALGFIVGVLIFFFILLTGAIQWIASGGDKQSLEGARGKLSSAIIGLVVLLAVFATIQFIGKLFSVDLLNVTLPTLGT